MYLKAIASVLLAVSLLTTSAALATESADEVQSREIKRSVVPFSALWKTRPQRRDEPLREENVSDIEVRQIEGVTRNLFPGSVVYISAVTTGCPCEDGPDCDDQVWSVATADGNSRGIMLSNIEGEWQVGPLQEWWLTYDRILREYRESFQNGVRRSIEERQEFNKRMQTHYESFPFCAFDQEGE